MSGPLEARIKEVALACGFSRAGIAGVEPSEHRELYEWWVGEGHHGSMQYLARPDARARRYDLTQTLEGVRSAIVVAHEYGRPDPESVASDPGRAIVARYARGNDYHDVVLPRLKTLARRLAEDVGREVSASPYVDTGPLLERELAYRAGLGWQAKNTMLIDPTHGSYFFLGVLLTDVELAPDEPVRADHCGTCRACIDACPTGALLGRREDGAPVMDARRCISYLTIELRGAIPRELRSAIGNRVFGCDICQEVCPWSRKFAAESLESDYVPRDEMNARTLLEWAEDLVGMDDEAFRGRFRTSPVWRSRRAGLLRNVCVGLGNWGNAAAVPVLSGALEDDASLVRVHAAWALGRIGSGDAHQVLSTAFSTEADPEVRQEIQLALDESGTNP